MNPWLIPSWVGAIALALILIVAATIIIVGAIVGIRNNLANGRATREAAKYSGPQRIDNGGTR